MRKDQHVVPFRDGWAVRGARGFRVTSMHRTQREAIAAARSIANRRGGELLVHSRSGRIRRRDTSRSGDPSPPRSGQVGGHHRTPLAARVIARAPQRVDDRTPRA